MGQRFITDKEAYLEERVKLQQELEKLTPIPDDELEVAADVIENFTAHWEAAKGDMKAQQDLIQLIVARVWVQGERVVGMSLRPNYHITVGLDNTKPTEIPVGSRPDIMDGDIIIPRRGRRGSIWFWLCCVVLEVEPYTRSQKAAFTGREVGQFWIVGNLISDCRSAMPRSGICAKGAAASGMNWMSIHPA